LQLHLKERRLADAVVVALLLLLLLFSCCCCIVIVVDIVIVVYVDLDLTKRVSSMIFKCNSSFGLCVTDHESLIVRARDTWVMRKISATEIIGAVNFVFTTKIWKEIASTL